MKRTLFALLIFIPLIGTGISTPPDAPPGAPPVQTPTVPGTPIASTTPRPSVTPTPTATAPAGPPDAPPAPPAPTATPTPTSTPTPTGTSIPADGCTLAHIAATILSDTAVQLTNTSTEIDCVLTISNVRYQACAPAAPPSCSIYLTAEILYLTRGQSETFESVEPCEVHVRIRGNAINMVEPVYPPGIEAQRVRRWTPACPS